MYLDVNFLDSTGWLVDISAAAKKGIDKSGFLGLQMELPVGIETKREKTQENALRLLYSLIVIIILSSIGDPPPFHVTK